MLSFDAETTRVLDTAYVGADLTRRRQASFDALAPRPGDTILDIGCGNGLLTEELARAVGAAGKVIGIDPSEDMRASADKRCKGLDCVELLAGTAHDLPLQDMSVDRAVSVQVFEYIDDIDGALTEMLRVLKPGGRIVISDIHFGTFTWFSDDPMRMDSMMASWDQHCVHRDVSAKLSALLATKGHNVSDVRAHTMTDHVLKSDGVAVTMMHLMKAYAVANRHVDAETAEAWFDEQLNLASEGRFFFSMTQFVVMAQKTG